MEGGGQRVLDALILQSTTAQLIPPPMFPLNGLSSSQKVMLLCCFRCCFPQQHQTMLFSFVPFPAVLFLFSYCFFQPHVGGTIRSPPGASSLPLPPTSGAHPLFPLSIHRSINNRINTCSRHLPSSPTRRLLPVL